MLTIAALVVGYLFLPAPWNWLLVIGAATIDLAETIVMLWWSKRRRPAVGAGALVGRGGVALTRLDLRGKVRVQGEIWEAESSAPLDPGAAVVVHAVDGLVLKVEPGGEAG